MIKLKNGISVLVLLLASLPMMAQYFGRNKPQYEKFDFEVLESPHFEIYHYLENEEALQKFASWSEQWYHQHQEVLKDTIYGKNPLILYSNHPDFQQTNTISGQVSVGTGGVTEALKNRVVMPLAASHQQTHHVLGHELVHAFQYNMILKGDSTSLQSLSNLPLWMVEGLAEYLSIGREDAHTAMWMRDAVLNDDVPTLKDLSNPRYFPYRYGQVFWAFVTGIYGDQIIEPLFVGTAKYGLQQAVKQTLGVTYDKLSDLWVEAIKDYFGPFVAGKQENPAGKAILTEANSGRINIAPALSPNGRYLIFLSERNVFSIDVFLADARTGEVIRQVASSSREGHIDDFDFIESAGTWSPDSKSFAFVGVSRGQSVLIIKEPFSGKTLRELRFKELPVFRNPTWSPDGETIVLSGLVDGQPDLFAVDVESGTIRQLTDDPYSELHPNWSLDGRLLTFSTDRSSFDNGRQRGKYRFELAIMDYVTGVIRLPGVFPGADNLNPVFNNRGDIIFLSNRDGYRNVYRLVPDSAKVYQMTDLLTGVSGITHYAPAISVTQTERRNRYAYTRFYGCNYQLYSARPDDFLNREVDPEAVNMKAAMLPRLNRRSPTLVDANLQQLDTMDNLPVDSFRTKAYRPKFQLDYVGGAAGVGVGNTNIGTVSGAAGGVDFLFGDMLGNHQLFSSLSLNGQLVDIAGVVAYLNRNHRINWGVSYSHIPYRTGAFRFDSLVAVDIGGTTLPAYRYILDEVRIFEDRVGVFAQYPFSRVLRVEAGANYSFYYNRYDRVELYYDQFFQLLGQERERVDPEEAGLQLFQGQVGSVNVAFVGDNSYFGIASPLRGYRFRVGLERYFNGFGSRENLGGFNFTSVTTDLRKYFWLKPVSIAARAVHFGRYGEDSGTLPPLFVGYPWNVRGYDFGNASEILGANGRSIDQLFGSKMVISNLEVRLPFTGPEQLSLIKSGFLLTELAAFLDGGLAWNSLSDLTGNTPEGGIFSGRVRPVFSAGVSLRVNLFGAIVLEPYYAYPLLEETRGVFGLNITPGW